MERSEKPTEAINNTGYVFNGVPKGAVGTFPEWVVDKCKLERVSASKAVPAPEKPKALPKVHAKTAAAIAGAESAEDLARYLEDEGRPHVQAAAQARLEELTAHADHG